MWLPHNKMALKSSNSLLRLLKNPTKVASDKFITASKDEWHISWYPFIPSKWNIMVFLERKKCDLWYDFCYPGYH